MAVWQLDANRGMTPFTQRRRIALARSAGTPAARKNPWLPPRASYPRIFADRAEPVRHRTRLSSKWWTEPEPAARRPGGHTTAARARSREAPNAAAGTEGDVAI